MKTKKLNIINLILVLGMFIIVTFNNISKFQYPLLSSNLIFICLSIQLLILCYYFYKNKQKKYAILSLIGVIISFIFYMKRFI